jgi:hypothetical protein
MTTARVLEPYQQTFRGNGYINLPLAILAQAKRENHTLWMTFKESEYGRISRNCDALSVACWVIGEISSPPFFADAAAQAPVLGESPTQAGAES